MPSEKVTQLLHQVAGGDRAAVDALTPLVYQKLKRIAGGQLKGERPGHTLAATALDANLPAADIEVDGMFVGNAPTIQLAPGVHKLVVKNGAGQWQRDIQITGGSVTIHATLSSTAAVRRVAAR
jgi:hypothetical protein